MLSPPIHPVEYPLASADDETNTMSAIKISEIETLFERLDVDFIMKLDLLRLHSYVK